MSERVLVIAPHADDEVLGPGGSLARHVENGDDVSVVIISDRDNLSLEQRIQAKEARKALGYNNLKFLGLKDENLDGPASSIIKPLEEFYIEVRPHTVYIPHKGDYNLDHRSVFKASMVVCRTYQEAPPSRILSYEIPSSTSQGLMEPFVPNFYNRLRVNHLEKKIDAFEMYEEEHRTLPNPRNQDGLSNLAIHRGMECGYALAEAFTILREVA
jgi:LmbE family N-acetylglucosaminyl deacetylase